MTDKKFSVDLPSAEYNDIIDIVARRKGWRPQVRQAGKGLEAPKVIDNSQSPEEFLKEKTRREYLQFYITHQVSASGEEARAKIIEKGTKELNTKFGL